MRERVELMGQAESSGSTTGARDERAEAQRDEAAGDDLGSVVLGFFSSAHDTGKMAKTENGIGSLKQRQKKMLKKV